ncbi:MAG: DNA polymerase III subunit delta [Microbacteriaceae bacterium]|nr:DNA polymerase III subunit delta [Microbacteriaceae bacterium]
MPPKTVTISWDKIRLAPVVLISGAETFLADRALGILRDSLKDNVGECERIDIDSINAPAGEISGQASPSLFGDPKLITLQNFEKCNDETLEGLLEYLDHPQESVTLVVKHGGGVRGKKALEKIRSLGDSAIEVVCLPLKKDQERSDFAVAELRLAGKKIEPEALRILLQAFTENLAELSAACKQLAGDVASDVISTAEVNKYYGGRVETTGFKIADAAIAGKYSQALLLLRHALESGVDPVPIVAAFTYKIRSMLKVADAQSTGQGYSGTLGMSPAQFDYIGRDLRGWDQRVLAKLLVLVAETDADIKGQARTPSYSLEKLVRNVSNRSSEK